MKHFGERLIPVSEFTLPDDIDRLMRMPRIQARACSIKEVGLVHPPVIRRVGDGSMEIVAGNDRVAACLVLNQPAIRCSVVECTDAEARAMTAAENLERRAGEPDQAEVRVALVDALEQDIIDKVPDMPRKGSGRRKTARGLAREAAAKAAGVLPGTIRKAEYKARKQEELKAKAAEPPVRLLGMEVEGEFLSNITAVQAEVDAASNQLTRIQSALTKMGQLGFPAARVQMLKGRLDEVASLIRSARPAALCPYCKGLSSLMSRCAGCFTCGYISKSQEAGVIEALWDEASPVVQRDGKLVPLADIEQEAVGDDDMWATA